MADNIRPDGLMGGDRAYKGKGLGELTVWKCPSCATENTGPLDKGCVSCGAGSAQPRHIGVPPPYSTKLTGTKAVDESVSAADSMLEQAFKSWYARSGFNRYDVSPETRSLLLDAWTNGIAWYRTYLQRTTNVDDAAPGEDPQIVAVPRKVLEDVLAQLENTIDVPETEAQSPELLALISRIRELIE